MSGEVKENKMGVMPVNKLLLSMAVPMMISMLVQAMYNIVDSIFVAKLSEEALTAVSLAFPLQSLMISVCTGLCVGMNALLSRYLGAKDSEGVNKSALNGLLLIFIGYLIFLFVGLFLIPTFIGEVLDEKKMTVKVLRTNDTWYGMTYKEDVEAVKESFKGMIEDGMYEKDLFGDL